MLQIEDKGKAKRKRNASREEIGRERATMLQDNELWEGKTQNLVNICYNKLNIIVVRNFMMKTTLL
ncbi:hypothetical protein [Bacillus sp. AR18-7]|uniref:hypothetical protein n=1 Tax=Bacillus sp. AR18-7 TaxID=2217821 RepID=UPI0011CB21B0|nr:hypothetical protein [Bacillus sp. AR18-7]TXR68300.1 hypothetical protein DN395_00215 [Bacillus sp. AR18-7]